MRERGSGRYIRKAEVIIGTIQDCIDPFGLVSILNQEMLADYRPGNTRLKPRGGYGPVALF